MGVLSWGRRDGGSWRKPEGLQAGFPSAAIQRRPRAGSSPPQTWGRQGSSSTMALRSSRQDPGAVPPSFCVSTGPDPQEASASASAPEEDRLGDRLPAIPHPLSKSTHARGGKSEPRHCPPPAASLSWAPCPASRSAAFLLSCSPERVGARLCPPRAAFLTRHPELGEMSPSRKPSLAPARWVPLPCVAGHPTAWPRMNERLEAAWCPAWRLPVGWPAVVPHLCTSHPSWQAAQPPGRMGLSDSTRERPRAWCIAVEAG